jgi:uncharacterized lipoprotein YehR (DUF1307 family)
MQLSFNTKQYKTKPEDDFLFSQSMRTNYHGVAGAGQRVNYIDDRTRAVLCDTVSFAACLHIQYY